MDESSRSLDGGFGLVQSTPSQQAARREQAVLLAEALARLPEDYREVIILRHLEGLTFPEVAERMGRTVDSVKKLWARGLGPAPGPDERTRREPPQPLRTPMTRA